MPTKNEILDRIVSKANSPTSSGFCVTDLPGGLTTNEHKRQLREKKTREDAKRKQQSSTFPKAHKRSVLAKEPGDDTRMDVDALQNAIDCCRGTFGIVLTPYNPAWMANRQKLSSRDLYALCAAVGDATCHQDRVHAIRRLTRLGFRVGFVGNGSRIH